MDPKTVNESESTLHSVVEMVCNSNEPVTVRKPNGDAVKVIPVPKPIRMWKGRPVYKLEDAKYLYLECPWLLE